MALTKQQQNKRAQKQSKKAKARQQANNRYEQMVAERRAQSNRGGIDQEAFNKAAMGVLEGLEGMDCPEHKTGVALVVRGEGYSGASTLSCQWNDTYFVQQALACGKTEEEAFADLMELVDLGEMNFRDFADIDTRQEEETQALQQALDQNSPEVRLLKAATLFANVAHNASGKNKSVEGIPNKVRAVAMAAIHRLIRQIDPTATKVAIALTSMPASPGVLKDMGPVLKEQEVVYMDIHDEADSILIMNNKNETLASVSLHFWAHRGAPLLMVAGGPKTEVPAGTTIH